MFSPASGVHLHFCLRCQGCRCTDGAARRSRHRGRCCGCGSRCMEPGSPLAPTRGKAGWGRLLSAKSHRPWRNLGMHKHGDHTRVSEELQVGSSCFWGHSFRGRLSSPGRSSPPHSVGMSLRTARQRASENCGLNSTGTRFLWCIWPGTWQNEMPLPACIGVGRAFAFLSA